MAALIKKKPSYGKQIARCLSRHDASLTTTNVNGRRYPWFHINIKFLKKDFYTRVAAISVAHPIFIAARFPS